VTTPETPATSDPIAPTPDPSLPGPAPGGPTGAQPGRLARAFGPLTGLRVLVLVVAVAFLGGAIGWSVAEHRSDPLSDTDAGFLRDMGYHHEQAVEMSVLLLSDDSVDADLRSYAQEILLGQRFEQGIFNATLARFHRPTVVGSEVMGWMGPAIPRNAMPGLATAAQMARLRTATGTTAASLWISLMSEHHLGGLHMADYEARHGHDAVTRNVAAAIVKAQRSEVIDLANYRRLHHLAIPKGFTDPLKDQRLQPLSATGN
jgi:uncharacterized protein (DUF305 family)